MAAVAMPIERCARETRWRVAAIGQPQECCAQKTGEVDQASVSDFFHEDRIVFIKPRKERGEGKC